MAQGLSLGGPADRRRHAALRLARSGKGQAMGMQLGRLMAALARARSEERLALIGCPTKDELARADHEAPPALALQLRKPLAAREADSVERYRALVSSSSLCSKLEGLCLGDEGGGCLGCPTS